MSRPTEAQRERVRALARAHSERNHGYQVSRETAEALARANEAIAVEAAAPPVAEDSDELAAREAAAAAERAAARERVRDVTKRMSEAGAAGLRDDEREASSKILAALRPKPT
jgi:hypothetical protein